MQIAIMVYPGMTALDAVGPYELLRSIPKCELRFVWKEVGPVVTDSGVLVLGATHRFDETQRPDLILVPGSGPNTLTMMSDPDVLAWLREVHPHTRYTTSVCSGSAILAAAGILQDKAATSHWAALPLLSMHGAQAKPSERIVRDGKVFTSAGVSAGIDLALELLEEVVSEEHARVSQLVIEYDPQPRFDSGHMSKASPRIRALAVAAMSKDALSSATAIELPRVLLQRFRGLLKPSAQR